MDGQDDTSKRVTGRHFAPATAVFPRVLLSIDQVDGEAKVDEVHTGSGSSSSAPPRHRWDLPTLGPLPTEGDTNTAAVRATSSQPVSSRVYRMPKRAGATPRERLPRLVSSTDEVDEEEDDDELIAPPDISRKAKHRRAAPDQDLPGAGDEVPPDDGVRVAVLAGPTLPTEVDASTVSNWATIAAGRVGGRPPPCGEKPAPSPRVMFVVRPTLPDAQPSPPIPEAAPWSSFESQPRVKVAPRRVPVVEAAPRRRPKAPKVAEPQGVIEPVVAEPAPAPAPRRVGRPRSVTVATIITDVDQTPLDERTTLSAPLRLGVFADDVIVVEVDGFRRALTGEAAIRVQTALLEGMKALKRPKPRPLPRWRKPRAGAVASG